MVRIAIVGSRVVRGRVLSFDVEAALTYGVVSAAHESKGRRMSFGDA